MIKNIILDVGGILFEDSKQNIEKVLDRNCDLICKKTYNLGFKECLLGYKTIQEHINSLSNEIDFKDISYILNKNNLSETYPLITENFEYIKQLKKEGYKIYLLTNITEETYVYVNNIINIKNTFDGGIYSYQEHLIKPDTKIYNLVIDRFNLNKKETIFFDDKEKNVIAARNVGIKSFVFKSIDDIKNNLRKMNK